ncbi:MAG: putative porin [Burkholderiales bacterium]|nr:putative porin [Burkholderiales bacterium]
MRFPSVVSAAFFLLLSAPALAQQAPAPAPAPKKKVAPKPANKPAPKAAPTATKPAPVAEAQAQLQKERAAVEQLRGTTVDLIRALVEEGVLSKEKAERMLGDGGREALADVTPKPRDRTVAAPAAIAAPGAATSAIDETTGMPVPGGDADVVPPADPSTEPARRKRGQTVRVPYVPETVKNEIRDQLKQEVLAQAKAERWAEPGSLPEWLDRITWEGDMRLRYQGDYYGPYNTPAATYNQLTGADVSNTTTDQERLRIRLRLGMLAKITDTLGAGIRIATGDLENPVSTNSTMGNTGKPNQLVLDRAYLKWDPSERWSVMGGRMPNPWFWPTDLVWDEDLNFEGIAGSFKPRLSPTTTGFFTAGLFPLQNRTPNPVSPNPKNAWLVGLQGGAEWKSDSRTRLKLGAGLFDFQNVESLRNTIGQPGLNDWSLPGFRQKGNSVYDINFGIPGAAQSWGLLSQYRVLNIGGDLELAQFDPFFIRLVGDYAKNIGFDAEEMRARTGFAVEEKTTGYQARLTVGAEAIRKLHDWQFFIGYRYLEPDAVLDAFTDSDFMQGSTNAKGYVVGGFYGLERNAFLRLRYLSGRQIVGPPLSIDILQADFNVRF